MLKLLQSSLLVGFFLFLSHTTYAQGPSIQSLSPENQAREVSFETDLMITFDSNVQKGSGNILIKQLDDDAIVETIAVSSDQVVVGNAVATINPATTLEASKSYYIEIAAGAFNNISGVAFAGISDNTTWSFSTLTAPKAPTNLSIIITSASAVSLAWEDNAHNEAAYEVQRSSAIDFSRDLLTTALSANSISFQDNGLSTEETYYYKVFALNSADTVTSNVVANMACPPDLRFSAGVGAAYRTISIGDQLSLTGAVINKGGCTPNIALKPAYKVFISDDEILDVQDLNISGPSGVQLQNLKEGQSEALQAVTIPNEASLLGHKYLLIQLDPEQKIYESNKDNNIKSIPLTISRAADVAIENLTLNAVDNNNGLLQISFDVVNLSQGPVDSLIAAVYSPIASSSNRLALIELTGLAEAERRSIQAQIPVSCTNFGTFDLLVKLNDTQANSLMPMIKESDTNNNTATVPYSFTGAGKPDLTFTSFSIPRVNTIDAGKSLSVRSVVTNYGDDLNSDSDITYFLSTDAQYDAGDIALDSSTIPAGIGCKEPVQFEKILAIPAGTATGDHYILALIDQGKALDELKEDNNMAAAALVVSNDPDLVVNNVVVTNSPNSMGEISLSFHVTNQGNGPVNSSALDVYLSDNNALEASVDEKINIQDYLHIPKLAAGATYSGNVSISLQSCTAVGNKYVLVKADAYHYEIGAENIIPETNEGNNVGTSATAIEITAIPDLSIAIAAVSSSAASSVTASGTITNHVGSAAGSTLTFYLSNNESLGSSDVALKSVALEAMACEEQVAINELITLPGCLARGEYFIIAKVDATDAVAELDEINNTDFFIFTKEADSPLAGLTANSTEITTSSAVLRWDAVAGAGGYEIFVYNLELNYEASISADTNFIKVTNLQENTAYSWKAKVTCVEGAVQEWSAEAAIKTNAPAAPHACEVATPTGLSASNVTPNSATLNWNVATGVIAYEVYVDGLGIVEANVSTNSYELTGLSPQTSYYIVVRAKCSETVKSDWSTALYFRTSPEGCDSPTNLSASNITASSATLNWTAATSAIAYEVYVDGLGIVEANVSTNSYELSGLTPGTSYYIVVRAKCSESVKSDWSSALNFRTKSEGCDSPTNLSASNITANSATLNWDVAAGAIAYEVYVDGLGIVDANVSTNSYELSGLTPGTSYYIVVRAKCSETVKSDWSTALYFRTSSATATSASRAHSNFDSESVAEEDTYQSLEISLYPNPSEDQVYISLDSYDRITNLTVVNMQGAIVKRLEGMSSNLETINLKDYGAGMYIIKVIINNEYSVTKKVVIK